MSKDMFGACAPSEGVILSLADRKHRTGTGPRRVKFFDSPVVEVDEIIVSADERQSDNTVGYSEIQVTNKISSQSAAEMIGHVSGVHLLQFGGLEEVTSLSIRGSTSSQVSILLDGIPLETASGEGLSLGQISADSLSQIQIFKSFSPSQFGQSAIGGVVNLKSKSLSEGSEWRVRLSGGSFETANGFLQFQKKFRHFHFSSAFHYRRSSGNFSFLDDNGTPLNTGDDQKVKRQNNESQSFHPFFHFTYQLSQATELETSQHFFHIGRGVPGLGSFQSLVAGQSLSEWLGQVSLNHKGFVLQNDRLQNSLFWRLIKSQFSDPNGEIGLGLSQDNDNFTLVFGDRLLWDIPLSQNFSLTPQIEYLFERFAPKDFLAANPLGSVSQRHQLNFSLQPKINFFDDKFFSEGLFWVGNAFYKINNDDPSLTSAGNFFSNRTEHPLITSLALRYNPFDRFFVKGSFGRSVRLPKFTELFGDQGFILGNAQLVSEKNIKFDFDVSWKKFFRGFFNRFHVEADYFENHLDDLIQFEVASGVARAGNLGEARIRGVEVSMDLAFAEFFGFSQNYTWQRAQDTTQSPARFLVGRPEHEFNFSLSFEKNPVFLSMSLNYIDNQYLDSLNTQVIKNRFRFDALASYQITFDTEQTQDLKLSIEGKNLLGTQIVDAVGFPLPGRSVFISAETRF